MFTNWWNRKTLTNQTSPGVVKLGRDWATYSERGRELTFTVDSGVGYVAIFAGSVTRWNDDPSTLIDSETQHRIVESVRNELEACGLVVELQP